ncbi:MAG: formate--tetrahydrofolate ligase [Chloroflexota bacterium]|nr:MAG: formate--tetrahydrofolate ligase [Chloroflexota bacterium]
MKSDIEIAQAATLRPIMDVGTEAGLHEDELELYGRYKAKVLPYAFDRLRSQPDGKLVLVTAMTPTVAGEGKTTTTVGLAQALCKIGKRAVATIREAAMGPVFGVKGGAAGGGYSQVIPMEDINLHFTGDMHAITAANNLLAAVIDNHLQQGNALGIDPRRITWRRCLDVNDRSLRQVIIGLGGPTEGLPRETGFDITPASEVMAVFCLSEDLADLTRRVGRIVIGYTRAREPIRVSDLKAEGALTALLRDALSPNLVQTLEGGPALIHGGPFGNIAHGTNTIRATRLGRKLGDYALVETGFGADLGFEKFCDIVAPQTGLQPDAAVIIASVRALKLHGGVNKKDLASENVDAVRAGMPNLRRHVANVDKFGVPALVAINVFPTDTEPELAAVEEELRDAGITAARSSIHADGGEGGREMALALDDLLAREHTRFRPLYEEDTPLRQKIETIASCIYGAGGVDFVGTAPRDLDRYEKLGYGDLPICMAKTQYSFSDDPTKLNVPEGFRISVRSARLSAGAGFVVALTGDIMTMPGLGKTPAAERIGVEADGRIVGLD